MKNTILLFIACLVSTISHAQVTITASDMPVAGDTLRYSIDLTSTTTINTATTGANTTWNFSALVADTQQIDTYRTALQVNPIYAATISPTAYGYKVADSLPTMGLPLPVSVNSIYNFFSKKNGPSRFVVEGFAANISGLPTAANYSDEDELYKFPLAFGNNDSTTFKLTFSLPTIGSVKQQGYRKNLVDGWGTIVTPYTSAPVNCIRIRSEVHEIDSVSFGPLNVGLPRTTVEYKWLANGEHYPLLWITASLVGSTETVTSIRYRDMKRQVSPPPNFVANINGGDYLLKAYPNPANNGIIKLALPAKWAKFTVEVFDLQGRRVAFFNNENEISLQAVPHGTYLLRVISGNNTGYITNVIR